MSEKNNSLSIFLIILLSIAGLAVVGFLATWPILRGKVAELLLKIQEKLMLITKQKLAM